MLRTRITFASLNTNIATVSDDGLITTLAVGETIITVTASDGGYVDYCRLTII